jgi:hypothetical protein
LSGDYDHHSFYGGCWKYGSVDTVGEQDVEDGITFVENTGETGVTLFNKKKAGSNNPGCLMRKSRKQVDLSVIGRLELDVSVTGQGTQPGTAPWYSVWLVPMNYSAPFANDKAAEIDLIENYSGSWGDMSSVASNFAQCGITDYTLAYCKNSHWPQRATEINHHITLKAHEDPNDGRVFEVRRCPNTGAPMETCEEGDFSQIKVQKPAPSIPDWFPIWNKDLVGDNYAKYWLAVDMWLTSDTDFAITVNNVQFFQDDDTEWKMPLDYGDVEVATQQTEVQASETVV